MSARHDVWADGAAYEAYVGRWSRAVSAQFLDWLDAAPGLAWLDVGSGTGALSQAVLDRCAPAEVVGVEPSDGFRAYAQAHVTDERARFLPGDARALPLDDVGPRDVAVSGLVLNFVPDAAAAVRSMSAAAPGGTVAAYVWDYAEGMELMRHFWDAAAAVDPGAAELDEADRFPICHRDALGALWRECGLRDVEVRAIEVPTNFASFDDYWAPFLGGQGAAPGYVAALVGDSRERLRTRLAEIVPAGEDGAIALTARAWAVRGLS